MHSLLRLRPGSWSRRSRLLALAATPLLTLPLLASPSTSSATTPIDAVEAAASPSVTSVRTSAVTLITGDTVTWRVSDGAPIIDVKPAPREDGDPVSFLSEGSHEDFYVYPTDVADYLASGALDRELFNIPKLIELGLDNASTRRLPVIVTFDDESGQHRLERAANALPATTHSVGVKTLNGAGVRVGRSGAGRFWAAVVDAQPRAGSKAAALDEGIAQIMLDQPVEAELDESVQQIGAPQLWEAGVTGEGVTVAVLDTGVDTGHPDLNGKVIAEENFTESETAGDRVGHGTHVASTVAGSGAASNGQYKGVAPDAELMNGKVLGDDGRGSSSWIIAGMEWAASNGADVVNMSLGTSAVSDGTDPLSQAVNQLTAEYDALFVIAAGNRGSLGVSSPGAADAALTVGAVDKADRLAWFSSRGPRLGDFAVKPNVTAPGVAIVAARAAGTSMGSPVDDSYTASDGTSMATPHVAGAAALLAQAHPDLDANALKDALASTAIDGGYAWREQGTGRIDVSRAANQGVYASAAVDFGSLDDADGPIERQVTYTNGTDATVTLDLESAVSDDEGEPVAGLSLSTDTITVPANGEAEVTATVDPADYERGVFGGVITASGGDVILRTGVGFGRFEEQIVTVQVLDSEGNPSEEAGAVRLVHDDWDPDDPVGERSYFVGADDEGVARARVPAGIYSATTGLYESDSDRVTLMVEPEVTVDAPTTITLDARESVPVQRPTVPRDVEVRTRSADLERQGPTSTYYTSTLSYANGGKVYVTPAPPGQLAPVRLRTHWLLAEPKPHLSTPRVPYYYTDTPAYSYHLAFDHTNGIPDRLSQTVSRRELVAIPNRYHAEGADALIAISELAVPQHFGASHFYFSYLVTRPGRITQYYLVDGNYAWLREAQIRSHPDQSSAFPFVVMYSGDRFLDSQAGTRRSQERWFEAPLRVGAAEIDDEFIHYFETRPLYGATRSATMARGGPDGNEFVPATDLMDNNAGHAAGHHYGDNWTEDRLGVWASWRMWNTDTDAELAPDTKYGATRPIFHLSPDPASYRLRQVETFPDFAEGVFHTRTKATTEWTFRSRPSTAEVADGYSCYRLGGKRPTLPDANLVCQFQPLIQLRYEHDLDLRNRAEAGKVHRLTIEAGAHSGAPDRAPVTDLTVEYSTDGGRSWRGSRVNKVQDRDGLQRYRVLVKHPPLNRTDGFVWLRLQAEDASGGTVKQTVQQAYILK